MEIRLINKDEVTIIEQCQRLAQQNYLDNMVLLRDFYPPCIHLTKIYGLFESRVNLVSFFVIFEGFKDSSIVLPVKQKQSYFTSIMDFLIEGLPDSFIFLSLELKKENIEDYFHVKDFHTDFCMTLSSTQELPIITSPYLKVASAQDLDRIDSFYKSIGSSPWHPSQMDSGYYHYIEINDQIVACGGTHFETPQLAQLGNIFVLEKFRRQGFGLILTIAITRKVLDEKKTATLFVNQYNKPAQDLYNKLGFKIHKPANLFICNKR